MLRVGCGGLQQVYAWAMVSLTTREDAEGPHEPAKEAAAANLVAAIEGALGHKFRDGGGGDGGAKFDPATSNSSSSPHFVPLPLRVARAASRAACDLVLRRALGFTLEIDERTGLRFWIREFGGRARGCSPCGSSFAPVPEVSRDRATPV